MKTFSASLTLCEGNPPVTGGFLTQRPVTWSFDIFFDLRLNKRLCKQSRRWWFATSSRPLWRHCNVYMGRILHGYLNGLTLQWKLFPNLLFHFTISSNQWSCWTKVTHLPLEGPHMSVMASQITRNSTLRSTACSSSQQGKLPLTVPLCWESNGDQGLLPVMWKASHIMTSS